LISRSPAPNAARALALCALAASPQVYAETATLSPGATTVISHTVNAPHAEPYLAVNPKNPANILATSLTIRNGEFGSVVYASFDGGQTWQQGSLSRGAEKLAQGGDAITYFDAAGTGYFASNDSDGLWISRSTDGGRTWGAATLLAGAEGFDRQFMGFDREGRFAGRIYAGASISTRDLDGRTAAALAISWSGDGGASFGQPYIVNSAAGDAPWAMTAIHVAPDGTVILPFATTRRAEGATARPPREWGFRVATSVNGGKSFEIGPQAFASTRDEDFRVEKYGGGFTSAIDLSQGPLRGRLYVVWLDPSSKGGKKGLDLKLIHSSDNGKSWSAPVLITDNADPAGHANPAVAVNKDGTVAVTWNDRRAHSNACYDFYATASLDGGETFLPNVKLSERATCATTPGANWDVRPRMVDYPVKAGSSEIQRQGLNVLMVATRWPSGGDTQGLEADSSGVFHAAWIDGGSGVMRLMHTPITVRPASAGGVVSVSRDVGAEIKLEVDACRFDWATKTFSCDMHLENRTQAAVEGPFTVVLQQSRSNLKELRISGADNGKTEVGAAWSMPLATGARSLAPGAKSPSRTFEWRFTGVPEEPQYPFFMFEVKSDAPLSRVRAAPPPAAR